LLAWMSDNQADGPTGARHFLQNNPEVWTQWVNAEVATKIKAAL
jgi:glycine betaine/proline transport system substrate-binding protein